MAKSRKCPQCGAVLIQINTDETPQGVDIYCECEECGYPEENRPENPQCVVCGMPGVGITGEQWRREDDWWWISTAYANGRNNLTNERTI